MKIRTKRPVLQANRIFTDREEPRASFWKNYHSFKAKMAADDGDVKVLAYYGIGGIGKSTLLKKLQEELSEQVQTPLWTYFDFNIAKDSRTVLEHLKTKLETDYKFNFPLFSMGTYMYARKIGEEVNAKAIQGMVDKDPVLNAAVTAVGYLPIVGFTAKLFMAADKGVATVKSVMSRHKQEVKDIEDKTPDELYNYLPVLFAQDLADNLKNTKEPMVVFLDTYEQLVNEMTVVGESLNNDLWLRGEEGLIQNCPNVFWVVAGREKLKWEKFDIGWCDSLEQHILGSLSNVDADNFLSSAGIAEQELRKGIIELTKGTPVYLDLCVDRYMSLKEQGKEVQLDDFGQNVYVLVERFARYMDDNKKDIVYLLSCLRMWDDEMVSNIACDIIPNFSMTSYEKVKEFSFVGQTDNDMYKIHQTVADILFANCPRLIRDKVAEIVPEYVQKKLATINVFDTQYGIYTRWLVEFGLNLYGDEKQLFDYLNNFVGLLIDDISESAQWVLSNGIIDALENEIKKFGEGILKGWIVRKKSKCCCDQGKYQEANEFAHKAKMLYEEHFGSDDIRTTEVLKILAVTYSNLGQYKEALEMDKEVLAKRKQVLGEDHLNTIDVMNNLAVTYSNLGQYNEALEMFKEVLAKRKQILGEDHPDTISALHNLANTYSDLGQYNEALEMKKEVLAKREQILGEDHPDTISAMQNLANTYSDLGQYNEALEMRKEVLEKRKQILGEDHPDTISAMYNLAITYTDLGQYNEALELQKEVLAKRKQILGEDHPDTISAMHNLAGTYHALGQYKEALVIYKEVLAKRRWVLGDDHPDTISAMLNLANTYSDLGKYNEALEMEKEVLEKRKQILGEDHPDTIRATGNLASTYYALGQYNEALEMFKEVLEKRKRILGEDHPDTIGATGNLASTYYALGQYNEALEMEKEVLEKRKQILGEEHPDTISAMNNLANTYSDLGQYSEALELQKEVLAKRKQILGEDHPDTNGAMNNLAITYSDLGQYKEALEMEKEILAKRRRILGEDHPDTIIVMHNLACTYIYLGKYNEALEMFKEVLEKRKQIFGEEHPDTISATDGLASTYNALGQYNEALEMYKEVFEKRKQILGEDHPDTISAMQNLANTYSDLGKYNEALEMFKEVLEKRKQILGEEHPGTISAMNGLAWMYFLSKEAVKGIPLAEKVVAYNENNANVNLRTIIGNKDTLAMLYADAGRTDEAVDMAKELLKLSLGSYADNSAFMGNRYYSLAYCLNKARKHNDAMENAQKAKELYSKANLKGGCQENKLVGALIDEIQNALLTN